MTTRLSCVVIVIISSEDRKFGTIGLDRTRSLEITWFRDGIASGTAKPSKLCISCCINDDNDNGDGDNAGVVAGVDVIAVVDDVVGDFNDDDSNCESSSDGTILDKNDTIIAIIVVVIIVIVY